MKNRILKCCLAIVFILAANTHIYPLSTETDETSDDRRIYKVIDGYWKFFQGPHSNAYKQSYNDAHWREVVVPHTWNMDILEGTGYYKGKAWYRKSFTVNDTLSKKRAFIRFQGVLTSAKVYINDEFVGQHHGGYSAFVFEITNVIKSDTVNQIAVEVDNRNNKDVVPCEDMLFTRFGGIYRPVEIIFTNKACITLCDYASPGVYITQKHVSRKSAELNMLAKFDNGYEKDRDVTVHTTITEPSGIMVWEKFQDITINKGIKNFEQKIVLDNPRLWNGKSDPHMYTFTVTLLENKKPVDAVIQPLGLRYFHVDPNEGFFLNGNHIDLNGVCRHQEWKQYGSALSDEQHEYDMALIEEIGANTIRLAHYQQAEIMYDLADKNGMIVWAEVPITPPYIKNNKQYKENCRQQLTELIRQNYNHPSIFMWGMYNEVWMPDEDAIEFQQLMKSEDPGRLTTAASNKDLMVRHEITDLIAWNKYFGWYNDDVHGLGKFLDEIHHEKPDLKIGVSEYGAGGCIAHQQQDLIKPDGIEGQFYPEQYQCYVHEQNYKELVNRSYIWGKYIWNMFDFSWPIVDRGDAEMQNHKGMVTFDREVKKDVFYFYKANWTNEAVLHITSKRHVKRDNPITDVKVYTNTGNIQLKINNKIIKQEPSLLNCTILWESITLKKGENIIEVSGELNGVSIIDSCKWIY